MRFVLQKWEQGNLSCRKEILQWLQKHFSHPQYNNELEMECGRDINLLLTCILVWLKKHLASSRALIPDLVCEQLGGICVFLYSVKIARHYVAFREQDGVNTLLLLLERPYSEVSNLNRQVIYRLLLRISQTQLQGKKDIYNENGEIRSIAGLALSLNDLKSSKLDPCVQMCCRDLILEQLIAYQPESYKANDIIAFTLTHESQELQIFGIEIIQLLIDTKSFYCVLLFAKNYHEEIMTNCLELMRRGTMGLRHKVLETLKLLTAYDTLQDLVLRRIADWIKILAIEDVSNPGEFNELEDTKEYRYYSQLSGPVVQAINFTVNLLTDSPSLDLAYVIGKLTLALLYIIHTESPSSLKYQTASTHLAFLLHQHTKHTLHQIVFISGIKNNELLELVSSSANPWKIAKSILRDEEHQNIAIMALYNLGWKRKILKPQHSDQIQDEILSTIENEMIVTLEEFVPELQWQPEYQINKADVLKNNEIYDDSMNIEMEEKMLNKLRQHFSRFNLKGTTSPFE